MPKLESQPLTPANQKRRATQIQRYEHQRQGEALHPPQPGDGERWRSEYLPRMKTVPIRTLARASGLSLRYCSLIRRGEYTPHPMYWDRLLSTVQSME